MAMVQIPESMVGMEQRSLASFEVVETKELSLVSFTGPTMKVFSL